MDYQFASNEFTGDELLKFYRQTYGAQINGSPFTSNSIQNWMRRKQIPAAYDGYKITSAIRHKHLSNLLVLKVDGLNRNEVIIDAIRISSTPLF